MRDPHDSQLLIPALAFFISVTLTPVVRALGTRWNVLAAPRSDRWHSQPTVHLGGIAMYAAMTAVLTTTLMFGVRPQLLSVLVASSLLFLVGLIDDLSDVRPSQKLLAQLAASALVVASGVIVRWTPSDAINQLSTILWIVGITNAFNLLDNMDGLAAGVAAIAAAFLTSIFLFNDQPTQAIIAASTAAASLGFLVYNFNPASIFMGDCGSMVLGFLLASLAFLDLDVSDERTQDAFSVALVPTVLLAIPIFDTTFVVVARIVSRRSIFQGGRDHISHRLVCYGFSERTAVLVLYLFSAVAGAFALTLNGLLSGH